MTKDILDAVYAALGEPLVLTLAALLIFSGIMLGVFTLHQRYCLHSDIGPTCRVAKAFVTTLMPVSGR